MSLRCSSPKDARANRPTLEDQRLTNRREPVNESCKALDNCVLNVRRARPDQISRGVEHPINLDLLRSEIERLFLRYQDNRRSTCGNCHGIRQYLLATF